MSSERQPRPQEVREMLERIVASDDFDATERGRRFFRYVVEESLAGRAERIKAYSVGLAVFDRAAGFDPQSDPVVRIEARRLRRSIERYYLLAGRKDALRISIPKGGYLPSFEWVDRFDSGPTADDTVIRSVDEALARSPAIFVEPFDLEGTLSDYPGFARGLTRHVVVALSRFSDLFVYGHETVQSVTEGRAANEPPGDLDIDFILSGGAIIGDGSFVLEVMLVRSEDGLVVWADRFEDCLRPDRIVATRDQVADRVVRSLAQPYGVLFSKRVRELDGHGPSEMTSCDCITRYYEYFRTFDRGAHVAVTKCLEETIARESTFAEAHACLAHCYIDAYRFAFPLSDASVDPLARATELAERSIVLAPRSSCGFHARALAYWFQNDISAAISMFETGLNLNPNATEIMADLGLRLALLCRWERAIPLLEKSFARNPAQPGTYRIGLSLHHFVAGRYDEALSEAMRINAPDVVYDHLLRAISLIRLGRREEAADAVARLLAINPDYGGVVLDDLLLRNVEPSLAASIVSALRDAGLPAVRGAVAS